MRDQNHNGFFLLAHIQEFEKENFVGLTVLNPEATQLQESGPLILESVLVVNEVNLTILRRLSLNIPKWQTKNIGLPLVVTPEILQESTQTFPLEILEFVQFPQWVSPTDPCKDLTFDPGHIIYAIRQEVERILRSIRTRVLISGGNETIPRAAVEEFRRRILRVVRGTCWLTNQTPIPEAVIVLQGFEQVADATSFPTLFSLFNHPIAGTRIEIEYLYAELLEIGRYVTELQIRTMRQNFF